MAGQHYCAIFIAFSMVVKSFVGIGKTSADNSILKNADRHPFEMIACDMANLIGASVHVCWGCALALLS